MSFAKVSIVGRLGRDPESAYTQSGKLRISFSMAADGRKKDAGPTWFNVSAFGEQAERLATMIERGYIAKGRMLYVEGQFEVRGYTGNDGMPRTSNDVNLTDWQFVGGGNQQEQQGSNQQASSHQGDDSLDDSSVPF